MDHLHRASLARTAAALERAAGFLALPLTALPDICALWRRTVHENASVSMIPAGKQNSCLERERPGGDPAALLSEGTVERSPGPLFRLPGLAGRPLLVLLLHGARPRRAARSTLMETSLLTPPLQTWRLTVLPGLVSLIIVATVAGLVTSLPLTFWITSPGWRPAESAAEPLDDLLDRDAPGRCS